MKTDSSNKSIYISLGVIVLGLAFSFLLALIAVRGVQTPSDMNAEGAQAPEENLFTEVSVDDDAFIGSADAPVTIVEFSDYQCPFCQSFIQESYPLLKQDYIDTGKVKLVFRDLPLGFHPNATPAAEAAECAGETSHEAYFAMHDRLFATQGAWSPLSQTEAKDFFKKEASALGYNIASCLDSGQMSEEVQKDLAEARSYGYAGTPTFNINGENLVGAVPYQEFVRVIESKLQK